MVRHKGHTSVGLVGMQWFMQVLTDAGRPDVAYAVAVQTTKPSWGYMVGKGATTIWERWDTDMQDGGMNGESQKILSGNLEAWLYQTLGGINYDPERPGFKHIILRPRPVGDLTFVRCSHRSLYGDIVSDWKIESGAFRLGRDHSAEHHGDGFRAGEGGEGRERRRRTRNSCAWKETPPFMRSVRGNTHSSHRHGGATGNDSKAFRISSIRFRLTPRSDRRPATPTGNE